MADRQSLGNWFMYIYVSYHRIGNASVSALSKFCHITDRSPLNNDPMIERLFVLLVANFFFNNFLFTKLKLPFSSQSD